jgi:sodium transport system ATP-binding protein
LITVNHLTRVFRDKQRGEVRAVDDVSFAVQPGEIFGLLGPNGAGKSTTLRILATLLKPSGGSAVLNGHDIAKNPTGVRSSIGFLSGDMGLYPRLSPREMITFYGRLGQVSNLEARVQRLIDQLGMREFADGRIDRLSTGQKQKTSIARTLVLDPPILILDEPTSALDVPTARIIEEAILEARGQGKAIIYSTHVMEEAEYLCDRIAVINHGQVRISGTMTELREATGKQRLREIFLDLLELSEKS